MWPVVFFYTPFSQPRQFPPWRKFQYDPGQFTPWNFRSVELSFLYCLSYRFLQRGIACNTDTLCCLRGASYLAPTRFGAEYCLTHAITNHPPKTDAPCSAVSLRQPSYLFTFAVRVVGQRIIAMHNESKQCLLIVVLLQTCNRLLHTAVKIKNIVKVHCNLCLVERIKEIGHTDE